MPFKLSEKNKSSLLVALAVLILIVLPIVLLLAHYLGDGFLNENILLLLWSWNTMLFLGFLRIMLEFIDQSR